MQLSNLPSAAAVPPASRCRTRHLLLALGDGLVIKHLVSSRGQGAGLGAKMKLEMRQGPHGRFMAVLLSGLS